MKNRLLKYLAVAFMVLSCSKVFAGSTSILSITDALTARDAMRSANVASDIVTINFTGTTVRVRDPNGVYDVKPSHAARGFYDRLPVPGWVTVEVFATDGRTLLGRALVKNRDMVWIYLDQTGYHVYSVTI